MIKTILVPIDGSEHSRKATALATDIAAKYSADVILVHVVAHGGAVPEELLKMAEVEHLAPTSPPIEPTPIHTPADTSVALQEYLNENRAEAAVSRVGQWILDQAERELRKSGITPKRKRLEDGDAVKAILKSAKEDEADLIVMGSRGLSTLSGLLMGSVSHKVCQLADCTCITVK